MKYSFGSVYKFQILHYNVKHSHIHAESWQLFRMPRDNGDQSVFLSQNVM